MNRNRLNKILYLLDALYPHKDNELHFQSPFELLLGTMLAAQATDRKVNEITGPLFAQYATPEAFLALGTEELEKRIRSIHYCKAKARHIMETCRMLTVDFGGEVPDTREALMRLPGVGRKTANVMLSYAWGKPAIAVDTHVFRVAIRLGLAREKDPLRTELALEKLIPRKWWTKAHSSMVLHGRRVCSARKPRCEACGLAPYCSFMLAGCAVRQEAE